MGRLQNDTTRTNCRPENCALQCQCHNNVQQKQAPPTGCQTSTMVYTWIVDRMIRAIHIVRLARQGVRLKQCTIKLGLYDKLGLDDISRPTTTTVCEDWQYEFLCTISNSKSVASGVSRKLLVSCDYGFNEVNANGCRALSSQQCDGSGSYNSMK